MSTIHRPARPATARRARAMTRKQRWMLLLAFEVLVYGFSQAIYRPVHPAGISVEISVTPNHVVT